MIAKLFVLTIFLFTHLYPMAKGTSAMQFLKITVGSRATSMGETSMPICGDVSTVFSNPAGLYFIDRKQVLFSYIEYIQDIRYGVFSFAYPTNRYGTFAVSAGYLYVANIPRTIFTPTAGYGYEHAGTFSVSDLLIALSYARFLDKGIYLGMNLKCVVETLDEYSAHSYMVDCGIVHKFDNYYIGVALQNFGTDVKFYAKRDPLPLILRVGAGYKISGFSVGADVFQAMDSDMELRAGFEYKLFEFLFIRAGYRLRGFDRNYRLGYLSGLTAGIGFKVMNYSLDVAFVPYGDLGDSYRISILGNF